MRPYPARFATVATLLAIAPTFCIGTSVAKLSVNQLVDNSDVVVSGTVISSRTAWDSSHRLIWTHYLLQVAEVSKGSAASRIEIAEPGGEIGGDGMVVPGAVTYTVGEHVFLFLRKMPNKYFRTTGWSQGKYNVDGSGHVQASATPAGLQVLAAGASAAELQLSGKTTAEAHAFVRARVSRRAQHRSAE